MRIIANTKINILNAAKSKDEKLLHNVLFDAISDIIEKNPEQIIQALQKANVNISSDANTQTIINSVAYNIVNNKIFQKNISVVIAFHNTGQRPEDKDFKGDWSNEDGGGEGGGYVTAISNAVGSIFTFASSTNELKSEEAKAKSAMMVAVFGTKEKRNYIPLVILGGILLIGGVVVWKLAK